MSAVAASHPVSGRSAMSPPRPRPLSKTKVEGFGFSTSERATHTGRARADRAVRRAAEERERERAGRQKRREDEEGRRLARKEEAEKGLDMSPRAVRRRARQSTPKLKYAKLSQMAAGQSRLAVARPVDPTLRYKGALRPEPPKKKAPPGSLGDDMGDVNLEEHLARSLQELRTRAEPPPLHTFGGVVAPRAPSTHAPRLPAFEKLVSPRILDGVGGYVSSGTTGKWSARTGAKHKQIKSSSTGPDVGTAPSTVNRGKIPFVPPQKNPDRPVDGFTRRWAPAHIDISPKSIKKIAEADNNKRSQDELRYVFEMIDSSSLDGLIDKDDLETILERLGYVTEPGEVEDILWEVDDDRDGGLTWEEFNTGAIARHTFWDAFLDHHCVPLVCSRFGRVWTDVFGVESGAVYERVRSDDDGLEPHRLFSLIEFLMFDLDADGFVGVDEVSN